MPAVLLKGQELWGPTNAKMIEPFLFVSKDSRPDKTSAQSAVIWDENVDWNTWLEGDHRMCWKAEEPVRCEVSTA